MLNMLQGKGIVLQCPEYTIEVLKDNCVDTIASGPVALAFIYICGCNSIHTLSCK